MKSKKIAVISLVAGAALIAGTGAAIAVSRVPAAQQNLRAAAPSAHLTSAALDATTESKYTPLAAPCRVADTRSSGAGILTSGTKRDFFIGGTTGFAPQGGTSGGCGIPATATAAAVTVTMVEATSNGFLHLWPKGASEPGSSFMNFAKSFNVSASGNASLGSGGAISLKALGAKSHVVIDVTGFYMKPMYALVSSSGTLINGSRTGAVSKLTTGEYEVHFDRKINTCNYAANSYSSRGGVLLEPRSGAEDAVFVETADSSGAIADEEFYLLVTC